MSGTRLPESGAEAPEAPRPKVAGAWVGYLILALILLYLIFIDAQAVHERAWARVASISVVTVAFLVVPTGGLRWVRRSARRGPPPG